jgi:ribosomal protein S18 acetylase RimI-like enzyme
MPNVEGAIEAVDETLREAVEVRPMRNDDLEPAELASARLFFDADQISRKVCDPEIQPRSTDGSKQWIERMRHFLTVDPDGCWVASDGDDIVGFAMSQNHGRLWFLATYGVATERQGMGTGRRLIDAVLAHADGSDACSPRPYTRGRPVDTDWRGSRSTRRCGWSEPSTGPRFAP